MPQPEIILEVKAEDGRHRVFLNGMPITRSFTDPDQVQIEFARFQAFLDNARMDALKAVLPYGFFEAPEARMVADPRG